MKSRVRVVYHYAQGNASVLEKYIEKLVLLILGVFGSVATLSSCVYKLPVDVFEVLRLSIGCGIIFSTLFLGKKIKKIAFPGGILVILLYLLWRKEAIIQEGTLWLKTFTACANEQGYELIFNFSDLDVRYIDTSVSSLLMMVILVLSFVTALLISTNGGIFFSILLLIVISIIGIFVDLDINIMSFTCIVAFAAGAVVVHNKPMGKYVYRYAMGVIAIVLILSMTIQLLLPKSQYKRSKAMNDVKKVFDNTFADISSRFSSIFYISDGYAGSGDIRNSKGSLKYDNKTDLTVTVLENGEHIYLKSFTGDKYSDGQWTEDNQKTEFLTTFEEDSLSYKVLELLSDEKISLYSSVFNHNIVKYDMIIEKKFDVRNEIFVPYESAGADGIRNDGRWTYKVNQMWDPNFKESGDYSVYENFIDKASTRVGTVRDLHMQSSIYEAFVYDEYLDLPEGIFEDIKYEFALMGINTSTNEGRQRVIKGLQKYFDDNYDYSLNFGKTEDGKDPLEYFFEDTKKGYCVHFASTAVIMLRAMGIPARYASGYIVHSGKVSEGKLVGNVSDNRGEKEYNLRKVNVTDKSAHAWVEVYYSDYGWVPVEMTPTVAGYRTGEVENQNQSSVQGETRPTASQEATKPTQKPSTSQATKPTKETTQAATMTSKPSETHTDEEKTTNNERVTDSGSGVIEGYDSDMGNMHKTTIADTLWLLIFPILALIVIALRYNIKHKKLKEKISNKNTDFSLNRVIILYRYMEKMLYYVNIRKSDEMTYIEYKELVKKELKCADEIDLDYLFDVSLLGKFSNQEEITNENMRKLTDNILHLDKCIYEELDFARKLIYKYIMVLHY